jgi:hypothetical protein
MAAVNVNCSIPEGLVISNDEGVTKVTLNGSATTWADKRNPRGAGFPASFQPAPGVTSVDSTYINTWLTANAALPLVVAGQVALA